MTTEALPAQVEKTKIPTTIELTTLATRHGIELGTRRLEKLARFADYFAELHADGYEDTYRDHENGLYIGLPGAQIIPPDYNTFSSPGVAQIDFTPLDSRIPTPEKATQIIRHGIRGLQDYVLLVEAGYIQAPAQLYGGTDKKMARVAERLGFSAQGQVRSIDDRQLKAIITAPLGTIKERIFSEAVRKLDETLSRRLGGQAILDKGLSSL